MSRIKLYFSKVISSIRHVPIGFLSRLIFIGALITGCRASLAAAGLTGTISDVKHVVVFVQENRSFDHYFGSLAGVAGFGDHSVLRFPNGNPAWQQPSGATTVWPFLTTNVFIGDVAHDWNSGHAAWNSGKWDGWIAGKGGETMVAYTRATLPFYYALADAYTICDAYFCSVMGSTNPNRIYVWSGTVDALGTAGGPVIDNSEPYPGFQWKTYPERLEAAGVSWRVYQEPDNYDDNALAWFYAFQQSEPGQALLDKGLDYVPDLVDAFRADVAAGTLPTVSWLIAPTDKSEHPPYSVARGEVLTDQLLSALKSNPEIWNSTVFILTYDENGGFFDHVVPPTPNSRTVEEFANGKIIGLGSRVPTILISPWSVGGYVSSETFDHTSILRFLEKCTGVQETNLSAWRRQVCGDLASAFDFAHPIFDRPALPAAVEPNQTSVVSPNPPTNGSLPPQESGFKPMRALPCQPEAIGRLDCTAHAFRLTLTNFGSASAHFSVYQNNVPTAFPSQFDLRPNTSASVSPTIDASGLFDASIYGPAGFVRNFAGSVANDCGFEVAVSFDSNEAMSLKFQNLSADPSTFAVQNGYNAAQNSMVTVSAGETTSIVASNAIFNGRYDLTVTLFGHPSFRRQMIGRLGGESVPKLSSNLHGSGLRLHFPAWAIAYRLESSTDINSPTWQPVTSSQTQSGGEILVDQPASEHTQFYRLRR